MNLCPQIKLCFSAGDKNDRKSEIFKDVIRIFSDNVEVEIFET